MSNNPFPSVPIKSSSSDDYLSREDVQAQIDALPKGMEHHAKGHNLMVLLLTLPKYAGKIELIESTTNANAIASPQGVVLALGNDAYKDKERYPYGPWCEVGERIIFQKYAGRTFKVETGQLLFFLRDDEPVGGIDKGYRIGEG